MKQTDKSTQLAFWTYGSKDKPHLLLIHGFTGSHEGFQYLIPELEKHFYVVAPDLPGFGASPLLNNPWTFKRIAEEVNEFSKSLGLMRPIVISHSMGGLVAAHMLALGKDIYNDKTVFITPVATRITKFESRTIGALGGALQYKAATKIPRVATSKLISRAATKVIMTTKDKELKKRINSHHFDNFDHFSSAEYYYALHRDITSQGAIDLADELKSYDSLIIAGEKDNVTPLKTEKVLASTLGAKIEIIPRVGHLMHYEKPNEVSALITKHLLD